MIYYKIMIFIKNHDLLLSKLKLRIKFTYDY